MYLVTKAGIICTSEEVGVFTTVIAYSEIRPSAPCLTTVRAVLFDRWLAATNTYNELPRVHNNKTTIWAQCTVEDGGQQRALVLAFWAACYHRPTPCARR